MATAGRGVRPARRIVATTLGFGLLAAVAALAGCRGGDRDDSFCSVMREPRAGLGELGPEGIDAVLAVFDDVADEVPERLRRDVEVVRLVVAARYDPTVEIDPATIERFFTATGEIDRALSDECGIEAGEAANLFEQLAAPDRDARGIGARP